MNNWYSLNLSTNNCVILANQILLQHSPVWSSISLQAELSSTTPETGCHYEALLKWRFTYSPINMVSVLLPPHFIALSWWPVLLISIMASSESQGPIPHYFVTCQEVPGWIEEGVGQLQSWQHSGILMHSDAFQKVFGLAPRIGISPRSHPSTGRAPMSPLRSPEPYEAPRSKTVLQNASHTWHIETSCPQRVIIVIF